MAENNTFNQTVESLFKGMDSFITTKTVVGDAIHIGDTIILPLVDVSFGVAAGDHTERGFGDPEWNHKVGEYQKSGWHHKSA